MKRLAPVVALLLLPLAACASEDEPTDYTAVVVEACTAEGESVEGAELDVSNPEVVNLSESAGNEKDAGDATYGISADAAWDTNTARLHCDVILTDGEVSEVVAIID